MTKHLLVVISCRFLTYNVCWNRQQQKWMIRSVQVCEQIEKIPSKRKEKLTLQLKNYNGMNSLKRLKYSQ